MNLASGQLEPNTVKSRHGSNPSLGLDLPPTIKLANNEEAGQRLSAASERTHLQDDEMQVEKSVVNDARANCDDRKLETSKEGTPLQQQPPSSSPKSGLVWYHIFETTPAVFNIPKRQQDILNRSDSWNPAPPGKTFPAGNLPREILEELQKSYLERQAKSSTDTSEPLLQIDIPKSRLSATSEMSSPSQDSEGQLSGWYSSPVAEKMSITLPPNSSTLLPDSSPEVQIPKTVARNMYSDLPPDSSAVLPDSSPQIQIPKTVAGDVGENIENIAEGDINNMDEAVSLDDCHKEGRESRKEQGETSLQFQGTSHDASADSDVEMSVASDSDMETSVPRALRQVRQAPLSVIHSRSRSRTPQTQEQMPAGSLLQITETQHGNLNSAQKQNVTPQVTTHSLNPLPALSLESAGNPSGALMPSTFTSSTFKETSTEEPYQSIFGVPLEPIAEQVKQQHGHQDIESSARIPNIKREPSWSLSPSPMDRKRAKLLGDIKFSQVVTEDPANIAIEERKEWFVKQDSSGMTESTRQHKLEGEPFQPMTFTPKVPRNIVKQEPDGYPIPNAFLPHSIFTASTPTSADPDDSRSLYLSFRVAYPEYTGTMEHFTQLCRKLCRSREHQAVWDDYVVRHSTDYEQYVLAKLRQGRTPIDYDEYYDGICSLKFTKGILNAALLRILLPNTELPSRRRVEYHGPRRLYDSYRPGRASGWYSSSRSK
jgi:hypothetical protein